MDSRVFLSFALAKLGNREASQKVLESINLINYDDPERIPFLKCYLTLTRFELRESLDLADCLNLPDTTQADVVYHITKSLSEKTLDRDQEIGVWRQFWRFYRNSLEPQMQTQIKKHVDAMELQRAKNERAISELERQKLADQMQYLQILAAISLLATGALIFGFQQSRLAKKERQVLQLEIKIKDEQEARNVMAAKAAHHLNNPIQALVGLCEANKQESKTIWASLDALFPPPSERDADTQSVFESFHKRFDAIEVNAAMIAKALKRASTITNELRIVSGVHGFTPRRITIGEIWSRLQAEIKEDELLGQISIISGDIKPVEALQVTWLEPVSFIFYVIKEGLESLRLDARAQFYAQSSIDDRGELLFFIKITAAEGLKDKKTDDWRELKFCQHLLQRYWITVKLQPGAQDLTLVIGLPSKEQSQN
jgi:hypothetical protein